MRCFLSAICLIASLCTQPALAEGCRAVPVTHPYPLLLGDDTAIVRLIDGSIWQIYVESDYIYGNDPKLFLCDDLTFLIVRDKIIDAQMLISGESLAAAPPVLPSDLAVVESRIAGYFTGLDGETTFVLRNGQEWRQAGRSIQSGYSPGAYVRQDIYEPKVLIIPVDGVYELFVEGLDQSTRVERFR